MKRRLLNLGIVAPIGLPLAAVVLGMVLGWYLPVGKQFSFICLGLGSVGALILFCLCQRTLLRNLPFLIVIIFLVALRMDLRLRPEFPPDHLIHHVTGKTVLLEGVLYEQPRVSGNATYLPLEARIVRSGKVCLPVQGRVELFLSQQDRNLRPGDILLLEASLRRWHRPANPGERDHRAFSFLKGVYVKGTVRDGNHLLKVGVAEGYGSKRLIQDIRVRLARFLNQVEDPTPRGLMKACFLGDRSELSEPVVAAFRCSGLSHLLAISGLHVGLAGLFVYGILKLLLARSQSLLLRCSVTKLAALGSLPMVLFYVLLTGSPLTAVRAAAMAALLTASLLLNRAHALGNAVGLVALLILLGDPASLFSASFWLSFAAVLGLLAARPWLQSGASVAVSVRERKGWYLFKGPLETFRKLLVVSLAASFATAPLTAYWFHQVTPWGVLANLIVVPLVGWFVLPMGFFSLFMSPISAPVAELFLQVAGCGARIAVLTAEVFSMIPGACLRTGTPGPMEIGLFYLAFGLCLKPGWPVWKRRLVSSALVAFLILVTVDILEPRMSRRLKITFLSVGNGDSALIEFPGGRRMMVDGGLARKGYYDSGSKILAPFLGRKDICRVDYLVASHGQADHYGGLQHLAEVFRPRELWIGPPTGQEEAAYRGFLDFCKKQGVQVREQCRGQGIFSLGGVELEIMHPPCRHEPDYDDLVKEGGGNSFNNHSLVIRLTHGSVRFLLTGDIEKGAERMLVTKSGGLKAFCLKVPHHGSRSSSSAAFLEAVDPGLAIISTGCENRFGFPSDKAVTRLRGQGVSLFRTDLDGAITVVSDGRGVRVRSFKGREEEYVLAEGGNKD